MADQPAPGQGPAGRPDPDHPVYGISVAAQLAGLPVPTLRLYEQYGLLAPARTDGGTRRYSEADIDRLRRIGELVDTGLNLRGVAMVLSLEADNARLEGRMARLQDRNKALRRDNARLREEGAGDE
jgi:DNA-binding transcriptional MerR regulator